MDKVTFGDAYKKALIQYGVGNDNTILGCTESEILELIHDQNVNALPPIYIKFMRYAGKRAGGLWAGTDAFYPYMKGLKQVAVDLLIENDFDFDLPDTSFVFLMHEGYQFMYFDTTVIDDPEVLYYMEGKDTIVSKGKFSRFITYFIEERANIIEQQSFLARFGY